MDVKNRYYRIYGLNIKSNRAIDQFLEIQSCEEVHTHVSFHPKTPSRYYDALKQGRLIYQSPGLVDGEIAFLKVCKYEERRDQHIILRYYDGNEFTFFVADRGGTQLDVYYSEDTRFQNILSYLSGPVIGVILKLKRRVCLHAGAISIKGKAVLFIGQKGAGKSTLVSCFAKLGYPVLSDDVAVLFKKEGGIWIQSGYPRLRLSENTVTDFLHRKAYGLTAVLSHSKKYYIPLGEEKGNHFLFQNLPLPLGAVYYIASRNKENLVSTRTCSPIEGFLKLSSNTYIEYLTQSDFRGLEVADLALIVESCPIKTLSRPDNLSRLEEVCHFIVEDFEG